MRVLQVSHNDAPPFPAVCRAHERALGMLGAHVTTIYLSRTMHGLPDGEHEYLSMHAVSGRRAAALLRERLASAEFDLCIAHRYKACVAASLSRRRVRIERTICVAHEFGFFAPRRRRWLRLIAARDVELAGVSPALARELEATDPLHLPALVLGDAIDVAELDATRLGRAQARGLLGIAPDAVAIGVVGRLTRKKRPDIALDVLAGVDAARRATLTLHFVGAGEARAALDARARELGVAGHVRHHGFVPDAARTMSAFDAIVFPSSRDSFGMVLIEAMVAGVPVLAAESTVARDVMGSLGTYFDVAAPDTAGDVVVRLTTQSGAERTRWAEAARERVSSRHSVAALADAYAAVLGTAAARPTAAS